MPVRKVQLQTAGNPAFFIEVVHLFRTIGPAPFLLGTEIETGRLLDPVESSRSEKSISATMSLAVSVSITSEPCFGG